MLMMFTVFKNRTFLTKRKKLSRNNDLTLNYWHTLVIVSLQANNVFINGCYLNTRLSRLEPKCTEC